MTRYANSFVQSTPINVGKKNPIQIGNLLSEYQVSEYFDLRTNSSGKAPRRAYVVHLKQRLSIVNSNADNFVLTTPSYSNYPILAVQRVVPSTSVANLNFYIEDYSPKTLNASVDTGQNQSANSSSSTSRQHTSGSSTSTTNSYDVSVSAGFFGEMPTGGISGGMSTSTTTSSDVSDSVGSGQDQGQESGRSSSMSIKDWGSYAFLDSNMQAPSWVWGQEYPWNVVNFRNSDSQGSITLPPNVIANLLDGTFVYPPSQISQFGLSFVAHAKWIFYVDGANGTSDEVVNFDHNLTYWAGSHQGGGTGGVTASISILTDQNGTDIETLSLNLPLLALVPIADSGSGNNAVVGLVKSEFISLPQAGPFRLKAGANNIYINAGTGFDALNDYDSVLTASNITAQKPASFTVQFKVVDPTLELNLYFRHWKTSTTNCLMTLNVNGQTITRHIDTTNAGSGTDNLTTVTLRNLDYTNPDFYDYLVMGLNTITVTVTPADGSTSCGYALRALAIQ